MEKILEADLTKPKPSGRSSSLGASVVDGGDVPTIGGWKWGQSGGGPAPAKRDTAADNV